MYNTKQRKAIKSDEERVVIIAPPGSGKTMTMIGAIEEFIQDGDKWTVVITFTNKAADEIKERLPFSYGTEISTIHSWSYRELIRLSKKHNFRVKLLEKPQIYEIIRPLMRRYRISPNSIDYVYNHVVGYINPDLFTKTRAKYNAVRDRYIEYKRKMHLYDFTDLPLYLKTKLEDFDEYLVLDGLFVDEFQDVDPDQLGVFNRVIAKKKFFIGDPDQAIYMFRGATKEIFKDLEDYTLYQLDTNYRSYQEILNFAYEFKDQEVSRINDTNFKNSMTLEVKAARGFGGVIIQEMPPKGLFKPAGIKYEGGRKYTTDIETLVLEELSKYEYQFLCRTNREVRRLEEMGFSNVSTIHKAKGLEYDNVAIIDFAGETEEDQNVAFVALTRARNRLMIINLEDYLKNGVRLAFGE